MGAAASFNTDIQSDETFDLLCPVCKLKGRNTEAEKYCVECQDYYCLTCVKIHEDFLLLSDHTILGKGRFPSGSDNLQLSPRIESSEPPPTAPSGRCDRHTLHHIDIYCQNHVDVGCDICMAVDHRLCQEIFYIPEFLQNNKNVSTKKTILEKLESTETTLKVQHEKFQREIHELMKKKAATLEHIRKFRTEINDRLDELEQNTVASCNRS